MAVFTRVKTWVSNEVLTASDLNGEFNNLLNNTIPASIEDYSADVSTMQTTADPGGSGSESLATTLAGEITRLRFAIKRIVGGAQWYTAPVIDLGSTISAADLASDAVTTAKILDLNVTEGKLAANAVTTTKIADSSVTAAKLAVANYVSSGSSSTFSTSNTSATDVTNLSAAITVTTGNKVRVRVGSDGGTNPCSFSASRSTERAGMYINILRGATTVAVYELETLATGSTSTFITTPPMISFLDAPTAGAHTYKVQVYNKNSGSSPNCSVSYCALTVEEVKG